MPALRWILIVLTLTCGIVGLSLVRAQTPAQPAPPPPPATTPPATIGDRVNTALGRFEQGAASAEAAVQQGFATVRAKIDMLGTEGRVYGRLRWDKDLSASALTVQANGDVVTLSGTVPDEAARNKAVKLARETVGVSQVVDQISLATAKH